MMVDGDWSLGGFLLARKFLYMHVHTLVSVTHHHHYYLSTLSLQECSAKYNALMKDLREEHATATA
jgi:hypothetical protein